MGTVSKKESKIKYKSIEFNKYLSVNKISLDEVSSEFLKWIKKMNFSKKENLSIKESLYFLDKEKLLFYDSNGLLNCVDIKISTEKKSDLTIENLFDFAKLKSIELWNREFDIDIELVNREWKRMGGCYISNKTTGINLIRMSKRRNDELTESEIYSILLHEMVHWHLHTIGLPYSDGDKEFVNEIERVGSHFSSTMKAKKAVEKYGRK